MINSDFKDREKGFSTLEMLIALALVSLFISAVLLVSFGSQSLAADSQTNTEALHKAQEILESALETSRNSFDSVADSNDQWVNGITYSTSTKISNATECGKQISTKVSWVGDHNRSEQVSLTSLLTNIPRMLALGRDCNFEPPTTPWKKPKSDNVGDLIEPSGNDGIDVDVIADEVTGDKLAILGSQHNSTDKSDLWIFNVNDSANPILLNTGGMNTSDKCTNDSPKVCGVNAVDAAGHYAYIANLGNGDLSGTPDEDFRNAQLQIIDISNPTSPTRAGFFSLNDSSIPISKRVDPAGNFPEGRVIYYYKNLVYIGLKETAGHEFHIIDVSNPPSPQWKGSFKLGTGIGHNVNAIVIREQEYLGSMKTIAFVASSVTTAAHPEVYILDVTTPSLVSQIGTFNPPGIRYGLSLAVVGNRLYLGREGNSSSGDASLSIADITNLASPTELGTGHNFLASVVSVIVVGDIGFIGTTDSNREFQVWNISDPNNLQMYNCNPADGNFSQLGNGMDYFDNTLYVAVRSQNAFRIIYDSLIAVCS